VRKKRVSSQIIEYKQTHTYCEACFKPAMAWPHHIQSRGAGGSDDPENLLSLCVYCHTKYHDKGVLAFMQHAPQLASKILAVHPHLRPLL
jgi:hypothetical protein